ncbi:MAG: NAD(P)/FAD-dependent oxidoreductase [Deltaproteobacteria bacterium]
MDRTKYLIAGASHAGLSALEAIRAYDEHGPVVLVSQEDALPYSPTILYHVVSGRTDPGSAYLRDDDYFARRDVTFLRGARVVSVDPEARSVSLESGDRIEFEKLLLATGARPLLPRIAGLSSVPYHVLRTLDDAVRIRSELTRHGSVAILGGGLIGLHCAESFAEHGLEVTVLEVESALLPGYFDGAAARFIESAFREHGVKILTSAKVTEIAKEGDGISLALEDRPPVRAGMLLVTVGVTPRIDFLAGSGIDTGEGVLVDESMKTNLGHVWAAGDVAQAQDFFGETRILNPILPDAVDQGRVAGMAMADDPYVQSYQGAVSQNFFQFVGHHAFAVGKSTIGEDQGEYEIAAHLDEDEARYWKLVFRDGLLEGAAGINSGLDPGIMWQLVVRRQKLGDLREQFLEDPIQAGRVAMSRWWR